MAVSTASPPTITKFEAIALYEGNASALARAFGIEPQAVYQWPDEAIPESRYLRLRYELKPEAFNADGSLRQAPSKPAHKAS